MMRMRFCLDVAAKRRLPEEQSTGCGVTMGASVGLNESARRTAPRRTVLNEAPRRRSRRMRLPPGLVRWLAGVVLVGAAAAKARDGDTRWFSVAHVAFEWALATWLISGLWPRRSRQAAILCFGLFAMISAYSWLQGEASCGCFGSTPVKPPYVLALDGLLVLLLWMSGGSAALRRLSTGRIGWAALGAVLCLAPLAVAAELYRRSIPPRPPVVRVLQPLSRPSASMAVYDMGYTRPGESVWLALDVPNPSSHRLPIAKAASDCVCLKLQDVPAALGSGDRTRFVLLFVAPKDVMAYSHAITLTMHDGQLPELLLRVNSRVGLPLAAPPGTDLGTLRPGEELRGAVSVRNDGAVPVKLLYGTCAQPGHILLAPREPVPAGGSLRVPVVVRYANQTPGVHEATIQVQSDCPVQGQLAITVRYTVAAAAAVD